MKKTTSEANCKILNFCAIIFAQELSKVLLIVFLVCESSNLSILNIFHCDLLNTATLYNTEETKSSQFVKKGNFVVQPLYKENFGQSNL